MIINQPFSIGDIIFLEPMYRHFMNKNGEKPIVPVMDHLLWIADYIDSATFVKISSWNRADFDRPRHDDDFLGMRFANQILHGYATHDHHDFENCMLDKYRLVGLDTEMWKGIQINFKDNKSMRLMEELKILDADGKIDEFILVNENSQAGNISINPVTDKKIIKMNISPRNTVIDWHLVMQMALENHHVSTSTFFIMQAIQNQFHFTSKVFLYPRPNEDGLRGISQLIPDFKYEIK